jgi:mono/diheme cytochrome c family protein
MKRSASLPYVAALVAAAALVAPSLAKHPHKAKMDGEQVFKQYCSSCHLGGGNRVNEKRPLAGSKQLASMANFKSYLSAPPGHMPYYQSIVKDKQTLQSLYEYCKKLPATPVNSAYNSVTQLTLALSR